MKIVLPSSVLSFFSETNCSDTGSEFFFYTPIGKGLGKQLADLMTGGNEDPAKIPCQFDGEAEFEFEKSDEILLDNLENLSFNGRVAVAKCFGGKLFSVVVRPAAKTSLPQPKSPVTNQYRLKDTKRNDVRFYSGMNPEFLFSNERLQRFIWAQIKNHNKGRINGLIIVSAATKSGKTELTQSLCLAHVLDNVKPGDKPHLVTFEDPLEKWNFWAGNDEKLTPISLIKQDGADPIKLAETSLDYGFYFTPRCCSSNNQNQDVESLDLGLRIALRQTPTAFYIGEIRDRKDWKSALDFAKTGHLVIATCHAANMVETFQKIFAAARVDSPNRRGEIASSLLAIINLKLISTMFYSPKRLALSPKPKSTLGAGKVKLKKELGDKHLFDEEKCTERIRASVPQMWIRSRQSTAAMVADGLASIIPNQDSVWSRMQTANAMIDQLKSDKEKTKVSALLNGDGDMDPESLEKLYKEVRSECIRLDFED